MVKPRNIKDEVEKKKKELEVRKVEFEDQLGSQQEEFKNTLESLSRSISQFHMHNKKDQHVEIAEKVEVINTSLAHCLAEAKKFNSRENLFDKDLTDYSRVQ